MSELLDNLKSRREAVSTEIAALTATAAPERKRALYDELAELEARIARLEAPIETDVRGVP